MTRKERVVAEIEIDKQLLFVLIAAGLGIIAWIFVHAESSGWTMVLLALLGLLVDSLGLAIVYRRLDNKLRRLEELD